MGKYVSSKIFQPGCFATLSVKVTRCYHCRLPVSKMAILKKFNEEWQKHRRPTAELVGVR